MVGRICPYARLEMEKRREGIPEPPYDSKLLFDEPDRVRQPFVGDKVREENVYKEIAAEEELQRGVPIPFEEAIAIEAMRRAMIKAKGLATQQGVQKAVTRAFPTKVGPGQGGAGSLMGRHVDTSQIGRSFARHKKYGLGVASYADDPRRP